MSTPEAPLSPELEAKLLEPYTYTLQNSGKQIASKFVLALNYWLNISPDKQETISSVVEMVKNVDLLVDDIQDNSSLRRGFPVAHRIYGIPLTINTAYHVCFLALEKLLESFPLETHFAAVRIFTEQMLLMHQGQGLDIYWRDAGICPTEEQYLEMIERKTSCFIGMIVRLMQLFSEDKRDFGYLINLIGTYIQIANDYQNLKLNEYAEYKGFADDITEGKFSFPIIHAIRNSPDDQALINILKQRTENVDLKKYALSRIEDVGSLAYTRKVMNELYEKTLEEVEKLGGNPYLKSFFEYMKEQPMMEQPI